MAIIGNFIYGTGDCGGIRDDDEAEKGKNLKSELEKAILQSQSSIIVLSKDYASSPWCLDELVKILDRKRTSELNRVMDKKHQRHEVLPVFYDVKPSHLRKQTGTIAESFVGYEKKIEEETDPQKKRSLIKKIEGWKLALTEVSDLIGLELQNHHSGHEAKFIKKIISVIGDKLRREFIDVAQYEIGIESRSESINKWVQDETSDVSVIAICGMGGIGKTTIAKFIFNQNYHSFEGCSFLEDMRENSKQPNGLVCLQSQLLSDITRKKCGRVNNVREGLAKIKILIRTRKVLLVLDDVDQRDKIYGICGMQNALFPGSKVIITTRNEKIVKPHQVYKVMPLDHNESIKLFSLYAFGEEHPTCHIEHTKRTIRICEGLPLALMLLGSSMGFFMLGKPEKELVYKYLEKLEQVPHTDIFDKLKISFDSLQDDYDRKVFLHIACFFVGTNKEYAMKILENCVDHVSVGVQNLVDRCLLTIDCYNVLRMHRSIQEMGREIVNRESQKVGERTRLWRNKDAFSVLRNETGTQNIEGLTLDMHMLKDSSTHAKKRSNEEFSDKSIFSKSFISLKRRCFSIFSGGSVSDTLTSCHNDVYLRADDFASMSNLSLLKLNYVHLTGSYKDFPKCLAWLSWHGYPLKTMPCKLKLENLVALDLQHSRLEQVWKQPRPDLPSLKFLDLSYSKWLARTPNFKGLPNLEKMIFTGCVSLIEVCESIEELEKLELLDLSDCKALRKLPRNIQKLISLKTLLISGSNIHEFPIEMKNMISLEVFDVSGINLSPLNDYSEEAKCWQRIVWSMVLVPQRLLPNNLSSSLPCSLKYINLSSCGLSDDSFSMNFSNISLPLLEELHLKNNPVQRLSNFKKGFGRLKHLYLDDCQELQFLDLNGLGIKTAFVWAYNCMSLENVTNPNGYTRLSLGCNCDKLAELEDCFEKGSRAEKGSTNKKKKNFNSPDFFDREALFEYGVYNLFFCGRGIPKFSGEKCEGSCISLIVPSDPGGRIEYLKVWCIIENITYERLSFVEIKNETKGVSWKYFPDYYVRPSITHVNWWSRWRFGNQMEAGDEISIRFGEEHYKVTECGFELVYSIQEEEIANTEKSHHHFPQLQLGVPADMFAELIQNTPEYICAGYF
jgi:Leucine-rich repeat (LRR) protein